MNNQPRIYVACLAAYNNGKLHGVWIDCTSDADEMQEQIDAMLAASPEPDAEEWEIHDSEYMSATDLQSIADYMEMIETLERDYGDDAQEILEAFEECFGSGNSAENIRDAYCGHYDSETDYAEQSADGTGMLDEIPENLRHYFDFEAFARDLFINDLIMSDNGHVFYRNW